MLEIDKDNFEAEVEKSNIPTVLDFWGPQCGPCLALMPDVEKLAESFAGKVKFCKVNVAGNRRLCIQLKVMSVPTFLFYKGGDTGMPGGFEIEGDQFRLLDKPGLGLDISF